MPAPPVLDRRALNRALLARQHLLRRTTKPVPRLLEHLVGLQAQNPQDPYVALWSRLDRFNPQRLSDLILRRKAVRLALMRSTIHLVTAEDCLTLRSLLAPKLERFFRSTPYWPLLEGVDRRTLVRAGRALLEEEPRTLRDLGKALQQRFPGRHAGALGFALRMYAPLVQVPPRGLWKASGATRHTTAEHWLGRPLGEALTTDALVLRYLRAFGPASVQDAQYWSGLTRLGETFERLRPTLRTFRDEDGKELFDHPRAPRPDPRTPAPPRFLPEFDNAFIAHADRRRITAHGLGLGFGGERWFPFLVDGFVQGRWRWAQRGGTATLRLNPLEPLQPSQRRAVEHEAKALLAFLAEDAAKRHLRWERTP